MRKMRATLALLFCCGCSSTDENQGPPTIDEIKANLSQLHVEPEAWTVEEELTTNAVVKAELFDGSRHEVTEHVEWLSENPEIVMVLPGTPVVVKGVTSGKAKIIALLDGNTGAAEMTVVDPTIVSFEITEVAETVHKGEDYQMVAVGTFSNNTTGEITPLVTWSVAEEKVAKVSNEDGSRGLVTGTGAGSTQVIATLRDITDDVPINVDCVYPNASARMMLGGVMPKVNWTTAYGPNSEPRPFSMEDIYCSEEFADVDTVIFYVGAMWCPACPSYLNMLSGLSDELANLNAYIVWIEAQDHAGAPCDSAESNTFLNDEIGAGTPGIRAGDGDVKPRAGAFALSPMVEAFPSAFVLRTRDMRVITHQGLSNYILPFPRIVRTPEEDWSDPENPPFTSNCGPDDEESFEPNDRSSQAALIPTGSFEAGICTDDPDFYQIDLTGNWRFKIEFTQEIGDLDIYLWDTARDRPVERSGSYVGSFTNDDNEEYEGSGPATVAVVGYYGSSAPYRVTLEAL